MVSIIQLLGCIMSIQDLPKAKLNIAIPAERLKMATDDPKAIPRAGDVVHLDQGFNDQDGKPMYLALGIGEDKNILWEAEVYESELDDLA